MCMPVRSACQVLQPIKFALWVGCGKGGGERQWLRHHHRRQCRLAGTPLQVWKPDALLSSRFRHLNFKRPVVTGGSGAVSGMQQELATRVWCCSRSIGAVRAAGIYLQPNRVLQTGA